MKIRRDESATLRLSQDLCGYGIYERVCVEKQLLIAERKVVDCAQQHAVVKDSGAAANHVLPDLKDRKRTRRAAQNYSDRAGCFRLPSARHS